LTAFLSGTRKRNRRRAALAQAAEAARVAELIRPPSPAGIRMRRTRERRREGKLSIRCDISAVQIEAMAKVGFIAPDMQDDPAEVVLGVSRLMDRLMRSGDIA